MAVTPGACSYCCVVVQQMLDDIMGANTPSNIVQETNGMLEAVTSSANTVGFEAVQTRSRTGKALPGIGNRKVEIKYRQRECGDVVDVCPSLCDPAAQVTEDMLCASVSVDCTKATSFRLSKEEFRQLCDSPSERQARVFADRVDALRKAVSEDLVAKYIAGLGNYYTAPGGVPVDSAVAPKTLYLFDDKAQAQALGIFPLIKDFRKSGFNGTPIVVGGDSFLAWNLARNIFAGDTEGRDVNRIQNVNSFIDFNIDSVFADGLEHALTWYPGAVQMVEWYQFEPGTVYEELKEDYQQTVLTVDGFSFDFQVRYNECDGCWDISLCKHYDLFKAPDDAFSAACNQLSNGCLQYLVDCGDLTCATSIKC